MVKHASHAPRIIAGAWRGRILQAPGGDTTRPTAQRTRQALFDMLAHAPWAGRSLLEGATVLDAFAGTGAIGLEALSRGAAHAIFVEQDAAAFACLAANIAACHATETTTLIRGDTLRLRQGQPQTLVFLDPPYRAGLIARATAALTRSGWIDNETIIVAELAQNGVISTSGQVLARRTHGAAQLVIWRETPSANLLLSNDPDSIPPP